MPIETESPGAAEQPGGQLSTDDFASGGTTTTSQEAAPSQPSGAAPTAGGQGAQQQGQQQPEALTIRGLVGQLGYQLGEDVGDDYGAILHLVQQAARAQQLSRQQQQGDLYAQLGRQLAPQAAKILQQPPSAAQPQRKPYEPPEWNPLWERVLQMDDASGRYIAKNPNVPQSIVDAANDYGSWMQGFMRNPVSVFQQFAEDREKGLQGRMEQVAVAAVQKYQQQQAVNAIIQSNGAWFYARDDQGQLMPDLVRGGARVSSLGQQYLEAVRFAAEAGVQDPVMRDEMARRMLRAEIAAATEPAGEAPAAPAPANPLAAQRQSRALPAGRPQLNPLQSLTRQQRAETPGATEPDRERTLSLTELLRQRMSEAGVQDQHFQAEGAFGG